MTYDIDIDRQALRSMKRLDKTAARRITEAIAALGDDPRPHGCKPLTGPYSGHYRLAVTGPGGEYRIVYKVNNKTQQITIIAAGPRENIY